MRGYYFMHRGWHENTVFHNNDERMLWVWLIEKAEYQPKKIFVKDKQVELQRGQLCFSIRYIADAIGTTKTRVERALKRFSDRDMIETDVRTGQMLVTVCNYNSYQAQGDTSEDTDETEVRTKYKEVNKERSKKNIILKPDDVSEQVWEDFKAHRKAKNAKITDTAMKTISREAAAAGWPLEDALTEICARGWQGFKADWVEKRAIAEQKENKFTGWKRDLASQIGVQSVENWFKTAELNEGVMTFDKKFTADWVKTHYSQQIEKTIGKTEISVRNA